MNFPFESMPLELFLIFIYAFSLFSPPFELWKHLFPWNQHKIFNEDHQNGIIKKPTVAVELLSKIDKIFYFIESKNLISAGVFTLFIAELLNIFCIYLWPYNDLKGEFATKIAVAVSAVSILFPVALLIVDNRSSSTIGLVHSQNLLSYSWSLPLGILLLFGVGRYSFPIHSYAGTLLAIGCISIAAFVFYRLIKIVMSPDIRKVNEIKIIKSQIYGSISRSIEERIGQDITRNFLRKNKFDGIEYRNFPFGDKTQYHVDPLETGVISEIHFEKLKQIYYRILSEISNKRLNLNPEHHENFSNIQEINNQDDSIHEESQRRLKFYVYGHVGQNIEIDTYLLEICGITPSLRNKLEPRMQNYKSLIRECFKVDNSKNQILLTEQFKEFCNDLRMISLRAAKESDIEKLEILRRYFEAWLEGLVNTFEDQNIKYNLESSEDEGSYFLWEVKKEWKPLKEIINIIYETGSRSLKSDSTDTPEFTKGIFDLSNYLFIKMFYKNEILSCRDLLKSNLSLSQIALCQNHRGSKWLIESLVLKIKSFCKHLLVQKIEKKEYPCDLSDPSFEFVELIVSILQEYLRLTLITKQLDLYKSFFNLIKEDLSFYKNNNIDHRMRILEIDYESNDYLKQEYNELKRKKEALNRVEYFKREVALGQGILIMMILYNKASNISEPFNEEELKEYLKIWKELFPSSLNKALIFCLRIHRDNLETQRKSHWEEHPSNVVYTPCFPFFLRVFLYLIFLKAAEEDEDNDPSSIEDEYLNRWGSSSFNFEDQNFLKEIEKYIESAIKMGFILENWKPSQQKLTSYLEEYNSNSNNHWKEKIVQTPLDNEIIDPIPRDFDETFMNTVRLRRLMHFDRKYETSKEALSSLQCWGLSQLYDRELLVKDSGISSSPVGTEYGSGFAESEDKMIFKKILEEIPSQDIQANDESINRFMGNIKEIRDKGFSMENIYFLTQGPDLISRLYRNPKFYLDYRIKEEKQEMLKKPLVDTDYFFLFEEEYFIPVYHFNFISHNDYDKENNIIIVERNSIVIEQTIDKSEGNHKIIPKSGFSFEIKDPLTDRSLRNQLISRNDLDYLNNLSPDEKERMAPLYVEINFQEIIDVKINKDNLIFSGKLCSTENV